MSSTKVKTLHDQIQFTSTYDTLNSLLTVVTATPHLLVTGDVVFIGSNFAPQDIPSVAVTVVNTTTFTASLPDYGITKGIVTIPFFRTGRTGRVVFTLPRSAGFTSIVQSAVTGTGGATYTPEVSLDGVHWIALTAITHTTVDGNTQFTPIEPAWAYGSINITTIGAATKLTVLYSS